MSEPLTPEESAEKVLTDLRADYDSIQHDAARVVDAWEGLPVRYRDVMPPELRKAIEALRDDGRDRWWVKVLAEGRRGE